MSQTNLLHNYPIWLPYSPHYKTTLGYPRARPGWLMLMPLLFVPAPCNNADLDDSNSALAGGYNPGHLMISVINSDHGTIHLMSLRLCSNADLTNSALDAVCNHSLLGHLMTSAISCDHQGQSIQHCNLAPNNLMTKYLDTEKSGGCVVHCGRTE